MIISDKYKAKIFIVDDEKTILEQYRYILEKNGYQVRDFSAATRALEFIESGEAVDLLISDVSMPEMSGISFVRLLRKRKIEIPVIITTGFADKETAIDALHLGVWSLLEKPIDMASLPEIVDLVLKKHEISKNNTKLKKDFTDFTQAIGSLIKRYHEESGLLDDFQNDIWLSPEKLNTKKSKIYQVFKKSIQSEAESLKIDFHECQELMSCPSSQTGGKSSVASELSIKLENAFKRYFTFVDDLISKMDSLDEMFSEKTGLPPRSGRK